MAFQRSVRFQNADSHVCTQIWVSHYLGLSIIDMKLGFWSTQKSGGHNNKYTMEVKWAE